MFCNKPRRFWFRDVWYGIGILRAFVDPYFPISLCSVIKLVDFGSDISGNLRAYGSFRIMGISESRGAILRGERSLRDPCKAGKRETVTFKHVVKGKTVLCTSRIRGQSRGDI